MPRDPKVRLLLAFAAVYVIWGSTYLAIRIAIETIPPFTMAAARFLVAGAVLLLWSRRSGAPAPTARQWRSAAVIGTLLLVGGNGGVVWAEQRVASGLAALIVGAEPLAAVLLDWVRPGGARPGPLIAVGLLVGFAGVGLLVAPGVVAGGTAVDTIGALALLFATVSWAAGSIYSRHADTPAAPMAATGANMLAGAAGLAVAALLNGEVAHYSAAMFATRSVVAWAYLVVFGAIVGFSAYIWLLRNTTLAKASTYAYVNPVVAVLLGWMVLREPLTPRTLLAAVIIVAGVVMISTLPYLSDRRRVAVLRRSGV